MLGHTDSTRTRATLREIADLSLEFGRMMMESGASSLAVDEITTMAATGLGADRVHLRIGYASLTMTLGLGSHEITRVCKIGSLGVNQRMCQTLSTTALRVREGSVTVDEVKAELSEIARSPSRHSDFTVAIAVGLACAAFGRLLDADWAGMAPIFLASLIAQCVRQQLNRHKINVFLCTAVVAFLGSMLCGLVARLVGSETVGRDMVVAVLFLVPGVPAFNAQFDLVQGRPTLGVARAVWVGLVVLYMTAGVWLARALVGGALR